MFIEYTFLFFYISTNYKYSFKLMIYFYYILSFKRKLNNLNKIFLYYVNIFTFGYVIYSIKENIYNSKSYFIIK